MDNLRTLSLLLLIFNLHLLTYIVLYFLFISVIFIIIQMDNLKTQQQQSDKIKESEAQALKGPLRDTQR